MVDLIFGSFSFLVRYIYIYIYIYIYYFSILFLAFVDILNILLANVDWLLETWN